MFPSQLSNKLQQITGSFSGFLPEFTLTLLFLLLIITDLILPKTFKKPLASIACIGLLMVGYLVYLQGLHTAPAYLFLHMLRLDSIAVFVKGILVLSTLFTVLLSQNASSKEGVKQDTHSGEYYALLIGMLLGLHLMVMAANLMMLYLAIELVSICSYILTTFKNDKKGAEGGLKYLLFGAMSSGIMIYGMSLLYGFTGTLSFSEPAFMEALTLMPQLPVLLAFFLTICGLLFKIAAIPFHIWAPDVYESAPTPVVAFFSVAPKSAAFVVLVRFLVSNHAIVQNNIELRNILIIISILTLIVGNFSALWQTQAKRMLAYSSIAHAGFILIGVISASESGIQSILFYLTVYIFMNFAAFLLIDQLHKQIHSENIQDYKGIGLTHPFLGITFLIVMIALTGLPPTAGFSAKLFIFSSLWQSYQHMQDNWLLALFLIGLFNIAIALFYYLRIPFFMFFRNSSEPISTNLSMYSRGLLVILLIPLLLFFFKTDWLMNLITSIRF